MSFACSGCGQKLHINKLRISGPDVLKPKPIRTNWCDKQSCLTKQKLFSNKIHKDLDEQGIKLIEYYQSIGDKELEEIAMAIYMVGKIEFL